METVWTLSIMPSDMTPRKTSETVTSSLLAVTQTAVGCGIGLLVAGKLRRPAQKITAATLFSVGLLLATPAVVGAIVKAWNRTERRSLRRLDSIRHDSGLHDESDVL